MGPLHFAGSHLIAYPVAIRRGLRQGSGFIVEHITNRMPSHVCIVQVCTFPYKFGVQVLRTEYITICRICTSNYGESTP